VTGARKLFSSFWTLQIAGWFFYWLMISITFVPVLAPGRSVAALFQLKLFRALFGFILTSILRLIYRRSSLSINVTPLLALIGSLIFGCAWIFLMSLYAWAASADFVFSDALINFPRNALDYSSTVLAWSALYFGAKYWQKSQADSENALESMAFANKAQLEMLRYQLNPHFLFNALNSIRASVEEDKDRAIRMITQLSEFLRYSLLNESAKMAPLSEEIEALRNYLAIEKIRFEDKLSVGLDIDERAELIMVPCFLLNPLIENAIKHGLRAGDGPLKIQIAARADDGKLTLEVANSGRLQNGGSGTGIGLKNVRERLANLYGEKGVFQLSEKEGFVRARIVMPATERN
jgi:two-component system, LytTR family, sensor kinase